MTIASVFFNNRSQAVRLPVEMRFEQHIKQVHIRKVGQDRIISPMENVWDSFFLSSERVSDDFMEERPKAKASQRELFDKAE